MRQGGSLHLLSRVRRKEEKAMNRFNEVLEEASLRVELNQLRRQLTSDEAKIAVRYLRSLIETRPKPEEPPAITSFGNCADHADIKLYPGLCEMYEKKKRAGLVLVKDVQKPV